MESATIEIPIRVHKMKPALRVAVVARSVFPLHGLGGLERHVYDLVRYLADAGVETTLITRPPKTHHGADAIHPGDHAQDRPLPDVSRSPAGAARR